MRGILYWFLLGLISSTQILLGHTEKTHQYIVREAYKLLELQKGPIPIMGSHVGFEEISSGPWTTGLVVTGVWREDEEDVIFDYSKTSPPTITGFAGLVIQASTLFSGVPGPDPFTSIPHFWNADGGDNESSVLEGSKLQRVPPWIGVVTRLRFLFTAPNAYYKIRRYATGGFGIDVDMF